MKTLLMLLSALAASLPAFAGDAAQLRSLGFSADGRRYAFLQYGTQDGSGFPYAEVAVVDVEKNTLVKSKSVVLESESATEKQAQSTALAKAGLAALGIKPGENPGRTLLIRPATDHSSYTNVLFSLTRESWGPVYELKVETKPLADASEGRWCTDMGGQLGMKLSLSGGPESSPVSLVLQEDQRVPASRGCVLGYSVAQVIHNGKALVVILAVQSVGFEGPDARYIAVTGTPALQ